MLSYWLSLPAIVMVYLGFASLQGALIHWLRREISKDSLIAATAFSALIFLPYSLSLPLPPLTRTAAWAAAFLLIAIFTTRPAALPAWFWSQRFSLQYAAVAMSLILVWNFSLINSQISVWGLISGVVAALAGGLAWRRSRALIA